MAFTFSHIVVAPLLYRLSKQQLPLAALVIGCMLPDLARVIFASPVNHHFSGMFGINLLCGLVFYALWQMFYRPIIYALMQWQLPVTTATNSFLGRMIAIMLICIGLLLGNFTHLLWDSFTHLDDRTWFAHDFLASTVQIYDFSMPMHRFLQYLTSFIVLPLLYLGFRSILRQPCIAPRSVYLNRDKAVLYLLGCFVFAASVTLLYIYVSNDFAQSSFYAQLSIGFKIFALGFVALFSLLCVLFHQHLKTLSRISTCDEPYK